MAHQESKKTDSRLAARCAAVASLGAAVIHFAVAPAHWGDWVASGVFFASMALFQLVWTFVAWSRPTNWVLAAGVLANGGAVALWVTACTAGIPFGPFAGQPEAVGSAGIAVLLLQIYVIMGAGWALLRGQQPEVVSGFSRAAVLVGANTVMAGAVAVGLASSLQGGHDHHHGGVTEAVTEAQGGHQVTHEGHPHHAEPVAPLPGKAPQPAEPEAGLPVTDMGLDITAPVDAAAPELPAAAPEPETDGHDHHHGD